MAIPKFDWSSLNRYELTEYVWSVYPKLINKELTVEKFHRTLGNHIKHNIPIKLKKLRDKKVENNCVWEGSDVGSGGGGGGGSSGGGGDGDDIDAGNGGGDDFSLPDPAS